MNETPLDLAVAAIRAEDARLEGVITDAQKKRARLADAQAVLAELLMLHPDAPPTVVHSPSTDDPPARRRDAADWKARASDMLRAGKSVADVAKTIGKAPQTIYASQTNGTVWRAGVNPSRQNGAKKRWEENVPNPPVRRGPTPADPYAELSEIDA